MSTEAWCGPPRHMEGLGPLVGPAEPCRHHSPRRAGPRLAAAGRSASKGAFGALRASVEGLAAGRDEQ